MKRRRSSRALARWIPGLILEAAVVVVVGFGVALLANGLSPRGIELGRDYFPDPDSDPEARVAARAEVGADRSHESGRDALLGVDDAGVHGQREGSADPATLQETMVPGTNQASDEASSSEVLERRLAGRGLALVRLPEVQAWFEDPAYDAEAIVFVDARNRPLYEEGHIPAAYRFDHFYPQETLAEVLPAALAAQWVMVYCNGGDCEDSEFAATFLRDAGVPSDRLRVYAGGLEEWQAAGLPIEIGPRRSGVFRTP